MHATCFHRFTIGLLSCYGHVLTVQLHVYHLPHVSLAPRLLVLGRLHAKLLAAIPHSNIQWRPSGYVGKLPPTFGFLHAQRDATSLCRLYRGPPGGRSHKLLQKPNVHDAELTRHLLFAAVEKWPPQGVGTLG